MVRRAERGFSLIEALIGLAILALVLMVGLATLYRLPRDMARDRARATACRRAEVIYESIRSGEFPLTYGATAIPVPAEPPFDEFEMVLTVEDASSEGLYEFRLDVRYEALGSEGSFSVTSLTWRP